MDEFHMRIVGWRFRNKTWSERGCNVTHIDIFIFYPILRLHQTNHGNPTHKKSHPHQKELGFIDDYELPFSLKKALRVVHCFWSHERPTDGNIFPRFRILLVFFNERSRKHGCLGYVGACTTLCV